MGVTLSEYHPEYRAYSCELPESLRLEHLSDDFIFDNRFLAQVGWREYTLGEVSCPTNYVQEASSINLRRSLKYVFGCLEAAWAFRWAKCTGGQPQYTK